MAIAFVSANNMNAGRVGHVEEACRLDDCHPLNSNHLNKLAPVSQSRAAVRAFFKVLTRFYDFRSADF